MIKFKLKLKLKLLTLGLLASLAGATPALAAEPYRLGVALGFTGTGKVYSQEGLQGIQIAVDEINAAGGLLGEHPIELFTANTRTRPEVAEQVVRDLIEDQSVRAVIGTYSSASALAIKPICREAGVLHIATISNAEDITRLDPSPFTFSVVPNSYMMAKATALGVSRLVREHEWSRYVTIASDYAWGRATQDVQVEVLGQLAPEVQLAAAYWPPLGETAFNAFITAIRGDQPDFVLATVAGVDNEYWLRDVRDYGLLGKVEMPGSLISVTELIRDANWLHRGTWARTRAPFFAHLDVPMMAAFVERYRARYDQHPTDWAVMSYDGVMALKQGVEAAGTIDSELVKDAMRGLEIETTRGRHYFRPVDNQLSSSAYFGRIADDPTYPFPIYADPIQFEAEAIWRPEPEIRAARAQ